MCRQGFPTASRGHTATGPHIADMYHHLSAHVDAGAEGLMTCPQGGDSVKFPFFLIPKPGSSPPHPIQPPRPQGDHFKDGNLRSPASEGHFRAQPPPGGDSTSHTGEGGPSGQFALKHRISNLQISGPLYILKPYGRPQRAFLNLGCSH